LDDERGRAKISLRSIRALIFRELIIRVFDADNDVNGRAPNGLLRVDAISAAPPYLLQRADMTWTRQ